MSQRLLREKRALITGGSGGIGRVVASHFLAHGAMVCIVGRDSERLSSALNDLNAGRAGRAIGLRCDVGDRTSVKRAVKQANRRLGGLDILVNCAGIQEPIGKFVDNDIAAWEHNLRVNLFGSVYCCNAVLPIFLDRGGGGIINFSGGGATSSRANFSAYATSKAAIVRFTEVLAEELLGTKIRVNAIAPGAVNTEMLDQILAAGPRAGKKEIGEARKRAATGGASADLAAELVVFLASNRSKGLSGKLISAPWDPWKTWDRVAIRQIMSESKYNLRRIS
jgi:NAD(P)-dependent dehydrogenase (short-subunit alcohol dehydrogenase family)